MNEASNQFINKLLEPSADQMFGMPDILLAMGVASLLCFALANVYRYTHRGTSYSQSYMVTLFAMAVCTAVVMMIIGSNIARAFSLVGALSIIRFRTAVKDPRDTAYLFAAMVAGMGCGTGFYLAAISMTAFICVLMIVLHAIDFGLKQRLEQIVRLTYNPGDDTLINIEAVLGEAFREFKLINRILDFGDGAETNVYVVRPGRSTVREDVESRLGAIEGVVSLALYESDQHNPF